MRGGIAVRVRIDFPHPIDNEWRQRIADLTKIGSRREAVIDEVVQEFLNAGQAAPLTRISRTNRRIGSPNQRKLLCRNDFTQIRRGPDAGGVYGQLAKKPGPSGVGDLPFRKWCVSMRDFFENFPNPMSRDAPRSLSPPDFTCPPTVRGRSPNE
jgi:hypothetical protein